MMDISEIRHRNVRMLVEQLEAEAGRHGRRAGGLVMMADRLGKQPAQISHFASENPSKNIGQKIAREIDAAFGKEPGWLDQPHWTEDGSETSQLVRLDPDMIAETHRALRELYQEQGRTYSIEDDPARFVLLYQARAALSAEATPGELIRFGARMAAIATPQGATVDGRSDGVPAQGTSQKNVARGVRKKA